MGKRSKLIILLFVISCLVMNLSGCSLVEQAIGQVFLYYLMFWIPAGLIFGFATRAVIYNKGYYDNWFWWGFFFLGIALIVAACKPENRSTQTLTSSLHSAYQESNRGGAWKCSCGKLNPNYLSFCECGMRKNESVARVKASAGQLNSNEWRCICGRINPNYMGTCACGKRKSEAFNETKKRNEMTKELIRRKASGDNNKTEKDTTETSTSSAVSANISSEQEKVKLLKEYKELFDSGVITEEEFNSKKASILKSDI